MTVIRKQTVEESATMLTGKSLNPLDALTPALKNGGAAERDHQGNRGWREGRPGVEIAPLSTQL